MARNAAPLRDQNSSLSLTGVREKADVVTILSSELREQDMSVVAQIATASRPSRTFHWVI